MAAPIVRTFAAAAVLLSGCVTQHPQNAEEFRRIAPGAFMVKVETHEVNRSVREIGETFQARAPDCMNTELPGIQLPRLVLPRRIERQHQL